MTGTTTSGPTTPSTDKAGPGGGATGGETAEDHGNGTPSQTAAADTSTDSPASASPDLPGPRRNGLFLGGLVALVAGIPLAVAVAVLRQPRWYPLLDLAQTELRLRAFETGDPPLVGLAGRVGGYNAEGIEVQGSHPGPISFWALWPFYKLFGSSPWAMQVASAILSTIAIGVSLWIAQRRAGRVGALVAAVALVVLAQSYGADKLTEAWNPYMPMLWWVVLLLAVWSVLADDLALLPVAVFAGCLCMQTHVPYSGLVLGSWALAGGAVLVGIWRRRRDRAFVGRALRWSGGALVVLVVLWIPPVIDQLTNEPGNLSLIKQTFTDPSPRYDSEAVGFGGHTLEIWLAHLNPWSLLRGTSSRMAEAAAGTWLPGVVLLALWAGAVALAWRLRARMAESSDLLRLHLVVGAGLLFGLVSISRILGFVWYYLVLWAWGTTALLIVATVWTYVRAWQLRTATAAAADDPPATTPTPGPARASWRARPGVAVLVASLVAVSAWFTVDAAATEVPAATESRVLRHTAPQIVAALHQDDVLGGGEDGRYLVDFNHDEMSIGSQGFGLVLALERAGFDVGVPAFHGTGAGEQRVLDPDAATAVVVYVVGPTGIARWRNLPEAVEVTAYDPRDEDQRAEYEALHDEVAIAYRAAGHDDLAEALDRNLLATALDERTTPDLARKIQEMMTLGLPAAAFLAPVGVLPPPEPAGSSTP